MALLPHPAVPTDLENIYTGVNSKAKSHVTIRWAVLEEIGNRVTTRATQGAKKAQNTKVPAQPTKTTNANQPLKPTASVKPVQVEMLAPKMNCPKLHAASFREVP
ncbi:G2/mitotic-specific cyclin-B2-like isoform X2 [Manis pentadactyla]|uniref:G2/mitotic-specific cyclin-B2-like isoform X2 n=1 Tax=Manis pentadactyla TaxID=143292 RepID=UPI00255CB1A7|nr:G2/mitotic-specific cyclin-B2-like isoform X2 [Manis pentadactyla]